MKRLFFLVAIVLIAFTSCAKDDSNKVLAKVGARKIKVGEFREAYTSIPPAYLPKEGGVTARKQVLDDLVSKNLLVLESYAKGLDKDKQIVDNMEKFRDKVVLTELYNREVISKAKVTEKELKERYEQMAREEEVHARQIFVSTPEKAQEVLKRAKAGEDFAGLAKKYSEDASTAPSGGDMGFIGKDAPLPPEFHDALFKLESGQVSDIVKTNFGFHIVKVDEKRKRQLEPFEQIKGRLESQLLGEKRMEFAKTYLDKVRKDYQVKINEVNIKALVDEINKVTAPSGTPVSEFAKGLAPDRKARPLATTTVGNYTTADFLTSLENAGYDRLPRGVNPEQIKGVVESEMIVKPLIADAKKTGVEKEKNVQKEIDRLKEEKMVELLYQKEVRDKITISDDEITSYYQAHAQNYGQPATLSVQKLVSHDGRTADSLAAVARKKADFAKLVEQNSIDRASAANGGQVQLRAGADPVIDSLAQKAKIGEIAGPALTGEGFVIIKMLDRKEAVSTPLEVARPYVKNDLQKEKEERSFQAFLKQARDKYKPSINEKLLAKIKLESPTTIAPQSKGPK